MFFPEILRLLMQFSNRAKPQFSDALNNLEGSAMLWIQRARSCFAASVTVEAMTRSSQIGPDAHLVNDARLGHVRWGS